MAVTLLQQPALRGRRILIVEDDCITAMDLAETLAAAGAHVVGPAATIDSALDLLAGEARPDIALLDIEVEGAYVFDIADQLVRLDVPIVFTTGYDRSEIPERFHGVPHCEKPIGIAAITRALSNELARK